MRHIVLFLLRAYQWLVSPLLASLGGPGLGCRFTPSCSQYACDAVAAHGARRGGWLAVCRLCRCHPWGPAGWDPAPACAPSQRISPAWTEKA